MIRRKRYIPLLILVVFGVCLIFFNLKSSVEDIQYAKRIFKSERAFGDDYFDIYLINSKGKQDNRKKNRWWLLYKIERVQTNDGKL